MQHQLEDAQPLLLSMPQARQQLRRHADREMDLLPLDPESTDRHHDGKCSA